MTFLNWRYLAETGPPSSGSRMCRRVQRRLTLKFTRDFARSFPLRWCHNEHDGVSNHQPHDCLLNRLFKAQIKETSKLRVTGLCAGNSPVTGEIPTQRASNADDVSIWWRHYVGHLISIIWATKTFSKPFIDRETLGKTTRTLRYNSDNETFR